MKTYIYLLMLLTLTSCFKDLGNYDYTPLDEIVIEEVPETLPDQILFVDTIRINPVVYLGKDKSAGKFNYYWSRKEGTGSEATFVRFSEEKDLAYPVDKSGDIVLLFEAENTETGVVRHKSVATKGTSLMSNGYYLLKENEAGNTDIDMIGFDSSTGEAHVYADLLQSNFEGALEGSPVAFDYWGYREENYETAELVAVPSIRVASKKDIIVINPNKFEKLAGFDDLFLDDAPVERDIQALKSIQANTMLINGGKVYCFTNYYTQIESSVSEEFGGNRFYAAMFGNYNMSENISWPISDNGADFLTYDKTSGLFKYISATASQPKDIRERATEPFFDENMHADLLFMESQATGVYGFSVYALFQSKQNPDSLSLLDLNAQGLSNGYLALNKHKHIKASEHLLDDASNYAVHQHYDYIYFSVDDKLYRFDPATSTEQLIRTFDGEKITHIDVTNEWYATTGAAPSETQYTKMIVATSAAGGYVFRKYDMDSSGLPSNEPTFTSEGTGKMKEYMYIKPSTIPVWVRTYN